MFLRRTAIIAMLAAGLATACESDRTEVIEEPVVRSVDEPIVDPNVEPPLENEQATGELVPPGQINVEEAAERTLIEEPFGQPIQERDYVRLTVPGNFDDTAERLEDAVGERDGIEVAKIFELDEMAEDVDTEIGKTHVFAISSAELLSPLVQAKPEIALDLPLKVLVYERAGQVHIVREDLKQIASRHGIAESDNRVQKMSDAMDAIIVSAAGEQRAEGVIRVQGNDEDSAVLGQEEARDY